MIQIELREEKKFQKYDQNKFIKKVKRKYLKEKYETKIQVLLKKSPDYARSSFIYLTKVPKTSLLICNIISIRNFLGLSGRTQKDSSNYIER